MALTISSCLHYLWSIGSSWHICQVWQSFSVTSIRFLWPTSRSTFHFIIHVFFHSRPFIKHAHTILTHLNLCRCTTVIISSIPSLSQLTTREPVCCFNVTSTYQYHHRTATVLRPFFWDHLGEPVPEGNFWTLWCKGRLTEADTATIRLGATPSGLTSAHVRHSPIFLQAECPSCRPTNSVKALKANPPTSNHSISAASVLWQILHQSFLCPSWSQTQMFIWENLSYIDLTFDSNWTLYRHSLVLWL